MLKLKVSFLNLPTHTPLKTELAQKMEDHIKSEDSPTLEEDKPLPYKKPSPYNQLQLQLMLLDGLPIKEEFSLDVEQA